MATRAKKEIPIRKCTACGGEFFREVTVHELLDPGSKDYYRVDPHGRISLMPHSFVGSANGNRTERLPVQPTNRPIGVVRENLIWPGTKEQGLGELALVGG